MKHILQNGNDDFFFDAINDDEVEDEAPEGEHPTQMSYASLEDMMESEDFNKPIQIPVDKSIAEVIIMIIKYSLIHSLSLTGIIDLFNIINCVFAQPVLPDTRYEGCSKNKVTLWFSQKILIY